MNVAIVEAAVRAGKPLLLEKPLASSLAEARRIRDLVAERGLRCMVAHTLRFNGVVRALRAHLDEIAPLQTMCLTQRFEPSILGWLDRRAESGGGIALHTGVHSFDLLHHLSGHEVGQVWGMVDRRFTRETEDSFSLLFRMREAPVHGSVSGSRTTLGRNGFIELGGERGQLVGDHVHGVAHLLRGRERTPLSVGGERAHGARGGAGLRDRAARRHAVSHHGGGWSPRRGRRRRLLSLRRPRRPRRGRALTRSTGAQDVGRVGVGIVLIAHCSLPVFRRAPVCSRRQAPSSLRGRPGGGRRR